MMDLINPADFEARAHEKHPKNACEYFASGAWNEITLHENHRAHDRIQLHPRRLIDVSQRDLSTSVLHQKISMPIMIAPTAFHGKAHADAALATARAAQAAGTILTLSTLSNTVVEDVAQAAQGSLWFQLDVYKEKSATVDLGRRVEASGIGGEEIYRPAASNWHAFNHYAGQGKIQFLARKRHESIGSW